MTIETKLIAIGNSRGIRIPKALLLKYGLETEIILEEREEGLLIHARDSKLMSWKDTYKALANEQEDWADWQDMEAPDDF